MKKALITLSLLLMLITVSIGGFLASLNTQYGAPVINYVFNSLFNVPVKVESTSVSMPYHLTLSGVDITANDTHYLEQVDIWFELNSLTQRRPIISSLLIDGASLQHGLDNFSIHDFIDQYQVTLHQLAINNLDYAQGEFNSRGVNLQVKNPQWLSSTQRFPFGELQLTAEQVYWHGEAIDRLLIDADFKPQDSTIYGSSFTWRGAKVSGQAEQFTQSWSLINVTFDGLILDSTQTTEIFSKPWPIELININHINSLDIIRSDLKGQTWHLAGFDMSVENLSLPFKPWQQTQGGLSIQAEGISANQQQLVGPSLNLSFTPNQIAINQFSGQWQQGRIQLNGALTPNRIDLAQLSLQGIKWSSEHKQPDLSLPSWVQQLNDISIQELSIKRSQFIQLAEEPFWQISGLDVEGKQLQLLSQGKAGLWQGELRAAVNNASYDKILTSHAVVEMNSKQGRWQLTRLFAPLDEGYIEAEATLNFAALSQPWSVLVTADGIPTLPVFSRLGLPVTLHGLAEFELQAKGLAGDQSMLAHSLTGQLNGSIRNAGVEVPNSNEEKTKALPVSISDIKIKMDRGRVIFEGVDITGEETKGTVAEGEVDLLTPEQHQLPINLNQGCYSLTGDFISGEYQQNVECVDTDTTHSTPSQATPEDSEE